MTGRALVLGGGGVTGIAWELGILQGLREAGLDLTDADTIIGTSAGSVVGAEITSARPLAEWYEVQLAPPDAEIGARFGAVEAMRMLVPALIPGSPYQRRRRLGRAALRHSGDPETRLRVIGSRLGDMGWPAGRDLRIVAVNARTGRSRVFTAHDGVDLVQAVAASCAVPTVWPAVTIDGTPFIDGGMRSVANADLAADHDRVVVLAPSPRSFTRASSVPAQVERLRAAGSRVVAVSPDDEAREAIGRNVLDPARRAGSALSGHRQAGTVIEQLREVWTA